MYIQNKLLLVSLSINHYYSSFFVQDAFYVLQKGRFTHTHNIHLYGFSKIKEINNKKFLQYVYKVSISIQKERK